MKGTAPSRCHCSSWSLGVSSSAWWRVVKVMDSKDGDRTNFELDSGLDKEHDKGLDQGLENAKALTPESG